MLSFLVLFSMATWLNEPVDADAIAAQAASWHEPGGVFYPDPDAAVVVLERGVGDDGRPWAIVEVGGVEIKVHGHLRRPRPVKCAGPFFR